MLCDAPYFVLRNLKKAEEEVNLLRSPSALLGRSQGGRRGIKLLEGVTPGASDPPPHGWGIGIPEALYGDLTTNIYSILAS